jgi:hypothetical protein
MAFIKHLKDTKFTKSDMMEHASEKECRYLFGIQKHSLKPFWCRLMDDAGRTRHEEVANSFELLQFMRKEFMEIIDEVASDINDAEGNHDPRFRKLYRF